MTRVRALILCMPALGGVALAATRAVVVSNAWSRPASETAVVYAELHNSATVTDRLVGASSPAARSVTLHETSGATSPRMSTSMDNMPMTGSMTSMKSLSSIPIPALGSTFLKPGGYHLMLDLRRGIKAGQIIPLRLHFERAGWVAASAHVRAVP